MMFVLTIAMALPQNSLCIDQDQVAAEQKVAVKKPWLKSTYVKIAGSVLAALGFTAMGITVWRSTHSPVGPVETTTIPNQAERQARRDKALKKIQADLLRRGEQVSFSQGVDTPQDAKNNTLLILAVTAENRDNDLIYRLLFQGARIDIENDKKMNALKYAIKRNDLNLFTILMTNGVHQDTDRSIFADALEYADGLGSIVNPKIKSKLQDWVEAEQKFGNK